MILVRQHRVLHAGKYYSESVIINDDVRELLRSNLYPANLIGIEVAVQRNAVAVFDTAPSNNATEAYICCHNIRICLSLWLPWSKI